MSEEYDDNFFTHLKSNIDPFLQVTPDQYNKYLQKKKATSVFNFNDGPVETRHSISATPEADYQSNIEILRHNPDYSSTTHYEIPSNPPPQCKSTLTSREKFTTEWGQRCLVEDYKPIPTTFISEHPIRHSTPHKGPGTQDLRSINVDGAYVRVAGLISQLSYELLDLTLPKWLPVFLDMIFYVDHQRIKFSNHTTDYDKLTHSVTQYVQTMAKVLDTLDKKKFDQKKKMELAIASSKTIEAKLKISVKFFTKYRADCELQGDCGVMFISATNLFKILDVEHVRPYLTPLISTFNQLYMATAVECVSYAHAEQAVPYCKAEGNFGVDQFVKIRTSNQTIKIRQEYRANAGRNEEPYFLTKEELELITTPITNSQVMYLFLRDTIRPTIKIVHAYSLHIDIHLIKSFNVEDVKNNVFQDILKLDRSLIKKSSIQQLNEKPNRAIVKIEPKLNGFQYQLKYTTADKRYHVTARYPQAPQCIFTANSIYDFDIIVEIAPTRVKTFEVRIISVQEIGSILPNSEENFFMLDKIRSMVRFTINCAFEWPYNKPDGLILSDAMGYQTYIRKNPTIDLFYDPLKDLPMIMSKQYIDGLPAYTKNEWASTLIQNHLKYKSKVYKENLRNQSIAADTENSSKQFTIPYESINMTLEQREIIDNPGPIYPVIPNCYNIPVSYIDYDSSNIHIVQFREISDVDALNLVFLDTIKRNQITSALEEELPLVPDLFYQ